MVPAHLSSAGALGGILSGRLSTKMLLGYVDPMPVPGREAWSDIQLTMLLGLPVYRFNAFGALGGQRMDRRRHARWAR